MSHSTPRVENGRLIDVAASIRLGSPQWYAWLADEGHRSFHYHGHGGDFTARKERKQRGAWYWVAYKQVHGKLWKTYLGKGECLTDARLEAAAYTLQQLVATHEHSY